jgi:hypothetical protein
VVDVVEVVDRADRSSPPRPRPSSLDVDWVVELEDAELPPPGCASSGRSLSSEVEARELALLDAVARPSSPASPEASELVADEAGPALPAPP